LYGRSPKQDLEVLRNEFDPRSPKLRITILSYLLAGDKTPTLDDLNEILNWIVEEREGFLEAVEASLPEETEDEQDKKSTSVEGWSSKSADGYL